MNWQQAPQPVVRPLQYLRSEQSIADAIIEQPEVDNTRELLAALHTEHYGDLVVGLLLDDNTLQGGVVICSGSNENTITVSSSNITNEIVIRDLPCSTNSVDENIIANVLSQIMDGICDIKGWSKDSVTTELRRYYDDSTIKYRIEL